MTETLMPSDPARVEAALIAGFLASRHYSHMPALLVVEDRERGNADDRDQRILPLNTALMLDLKHAISVQDALLERLRGSLEQEITHRDALAALLAVRQSQGIPDSGPAWDPAFDRLRAERPG